MSLDENAVRGIFAGPLVKSTYVKLTVNAQPVLLKNSTRSRPQGRNGDESGVAQTVGPLGGSYFVERMTLDMKKGAFDYFDKLDAMGGMVKAIEKGYPHKQIAEASYQFQRANEAKEIVTVGANEFVVEEP
jgi:hypothetical protein